MTKKRRLALLFALLSPLILRCFATSGEPELADTYSSGDIVPYWACASATPPPTATPQPPPPTPALVGTVPPDATEAPPWSPPNWPPTPWPTPTPYYMVGQFWRHQKIWIPVRTTQQLMPPPGATAQPPQSGFISLMLEAYSPASCGAPPPGGSCITFEFLIQNHNRMPVDVDLPASLFLRIEGDPTLYTTDPATLQSCGGVLQDLTLPPGESRVERVTICKPGGNDEHGSLRLGVLTSLYETRTGSAGMSRNAVSGSDTTIFINFWEYAPGCAYPPSQGIYPECAAPPPVFGSSAMFANEAAGGRFTGYAPVTIPPCYRITRGYGCSEFPTGVSGAGRCPADKPHWHTGIDFSCTTGTPVHSTMGGIITHFGCYQGNCGRSYGLLARVKKEFFEVYYAHLSSLGNNPLCSGLGGICEEGYRIGAVGSTGFSTGPHLHWEVRVGNVPRDPALYFGGSSSTTKPGGLAAPLLAATPVPSPTFALSDYPLTVVLRDGEGNGLSGPTLHVSDVDGAPVGSGPFVDGRFEIDLPPGVYNLRLEGYLSDGTPVHACGEVNQLAAEGGKLEYLYGPLSVWHDNPGTVAGLVVIQDADGIGQPCLDAAPSSTPVPLNPLDEGEPAAAADEPETGANQPLWLLLSAIALLIPLGTYRALRRVRERNAGRREV